MTAQNQQGNFSLRSRLRSRLGLYYLLRSQVGDSHHTDQWLSVFPPEQGFVNGEAEAVCQQEHEQKSWDGVRFHKRAGQREVQRSFDAEEQEVVENIHSDGPIGDVVKVSTHDFGKVREVFMGQPPDGVHGSLGKNNDQQSLPDGSPPAGISTPSYQSGQYHRWDQGYGHAGEEVRQAQQYLVGVVAPGQKVPEEDVDKELQKVSLGENPEDWEVRLEEPEQVGAPNENGQGEKGCDDQEFLCGGVNPWGFELLPEQKDREAQNAEEV
eukprot:CAMPEP_0196652092 /NCGR_PEP_ID=MMETSP1086-20130531/1321_1 /TAXON_ID=77921 /ORGANISM="Cyanoptyche  gloeocystis , Strain SAG4.97" /LENGTH=267 /DNA_ID=CAMNT_0041982467 /DNA_START=855 /DNA_END=1658 /DNA_ORIENTATION=-